MKQIEIINGNKLIAKFMGGKLCDGGFVKNASEMDAFSFLNRKYTFLELSYNFKWNWLMPVIEHIESMRNILVQIETDVQPNHAIQTKCKIIHFNDKGEQADIAIFFEEKKITATWKAVVQFIEWYNQNKKS